MTRGQAHLRSTRGARCEFPGCPTRATSTVKALRVTVSGRPVEVERLCAEHRRLLMAQPQRARTNEKRPRVRQGRYTCHGCGTIHASYRLAEQCADRHGGARIEAGP